MFEVVCITPSCKQAIKFIDELAIKLKQRGIDGFVIDRKNIQIKSKKGIISVVSIGTIPRASFHGAEYYVDAVSNHHKPYNCSIRKLNEWLEYLKCRFRPDAKEILEEELIEILTEV